MDKQQERRARQLAHRKRVAEAAKAPAPTPPVRQQVGLALRADRRHRGESQRAYAAGRGLSRDTLARAEVDSGGLLLTTLVCLLDGTGFELAILPTSAEGREPWWDRTDVEARTRTGSRFPAHRQVKEQPMGPLWWHYHEVLGSRGYGPQPKWSAEGFTPPPGTRYGKKPTPAPDGGPRWPYVVPDMPEMPDDGDAE